MLRYICALVGFDLSGQVAIGFSHWKSPFPASCQNLPSPDCVHSEASAIPPISELPDPTSCPASLSITPLPTFSASQETLCDNSMYSRTQLTVCSLQCSLFVLF